MSEQALDMKQKDVSAEKTEGVVSEEREATVDEILKKDMSKAQVLLKKRFRIYSTRPLPALDMPNAKAYIAEDLQALGRKVYALVIPPQMPLRIDNLKEMTSIKSVGLLELLDSGTVFWPLFSTKAKVLIYERPLGGRVMETEQSVIVPYDEQNILTNIPVFFSAIELMNSHGLTHRAIRPTNMYYLDEEKEHIVLGDSIICPPAYEQPVAFENIPSAMCMPAGRGKGSFSNDLYSLAVSIICLALGRNPLAKKSESEVLALKIQKGSYAAFLEGEKIYISLIELLRGLLADNPEHRWDLNTVKDWLAGQRQFRTSLIEKIKSSQRPFLFEGQEYFSYRSLANAFAHHWDKAAEAIKSEKFLAWISRGFNDQEMAEKINRAIQNSTSNYISKEEQEDYLITKVCMTLDLQAPLRTRKYSLLPEGLSFVMSMHALEKKDMKPLLKLISNGFLEMWYDVREDRINRQYIKNLQKILSSRDLGMGVERCLYELNEGLPCLSPLLEQEYIDDVRKLLPALDAVSKKADQKSWPLDRHVVAYIAKHFGGKVSNQLYAINRPNASQATAGMLSMLAMLQWTFGPEVLYGLTTWVGGLVGSVVDSYHSRNRRVALEKELPKYIRKGNLAALYRFLDAQEERENDMAAFFDARKEYTLIQKEVNTLENNKEDREKYYAGLGYQVASILSFSIALLTMFFLLLYRFLKG